MTTLDSTLRAAADRLRNAAESTTDVEAGLRAVTARSGTTTAPRSPRRIRRRAWWGAGAALTTGIASIVAVAVVRDTPSSQVVPAASTTASSTSPSSTSTSPETDSPTTAVPAATAISVSYLDPPPLYDPTKLGRLRLTLPSGDDVPPVAIGQDHYWVAVLDGGASAQLMGPATNGPWDVPLATVPLPVRPLFAVVLGPDDVLYGLWHAPESGVAELDAVAIPLTGPDQGKVVASVRHDATPFGDLPAYALGLGTTGVVDRSGRLGGNVIDYVGGATVGPPAGSRDSSRWQLEVQRAPDWGVELENDVVVARGDGAVLATTIGPEATQPVIAELHPDGTGTWWSLPEGWRLVASDIDGTLIAGPLDGQHLGVAQFAPVQDPIRAEGHINPASLVPAAVPCGRVFCAQLTNHDRGFVSLEGMTLTRYTAAGDATAAVEVTDLDNPVLVAVGPTDDVAYLRVSAGTPDPSDRLLAVALEGPRAGRVIATSGTIDGSGDSSLVAAARGIVSTSDIGPSARPANSDPIVLPWLDSTGAEVIHPGPFFAYDPVEQSIRVTAAGVINDWPLPGAEGLDRGVPSVEPTGAGLLVWRWDWAAGTPVLQLLTTDGAIITMVLPDGYEFAGFHDGSLLLSDGTTVWSAPI